MSTRHLRLILLICGALVLAGCAGSAQPGPSDVPDVPKITDSLDVTARSPCELLTQPQAADLGLGSGKPGQTDLGAQCVWRTEQVTLALTRYVDGGGLAAIARDADPAAARVRVMGYPALETFTEGGQYCRYDVGVSERQVIVATMKGGEPSSCAVLQDVLSYALKNLQSR